MSGGRQGQQDAVKLFICTQKDHALSLTETISLVYLTRL